jgi:predicted MFS family arabinose efflux permease
VATRWREAWARQWRGSLFRRRDFRLLWIGETTSQFGSAVTVVALPLVAVQALHAGPFEVALLTAVTWLPWVVIGLVAGAWVDRLPRRPVMLLCDMVSMLLLASVPVADWCGVLTIGQLLAVALLAGVCSVFFTSAYQAYLPALVEGEDLVEANAKLQGSQSAAQIGGPGLAGGIAALAGVATGLLVDAISFAASAVCLRSIDAREPERQAHAAGHDLREEVVEGLRFLLGDSYLRPVALAAAVGNLCLTGMESLLVYFLIKIVGLGSGGAGAMMALGGVGGVVGALCARRLANRFGTARAVFCCYLVALPFMLLVPLTRSGFGLIPFAGYAVTMAGAVAGNVVYDGFVQRYTPPEMMGRIAASGSTIAYCCMPLGAVLAGALGSLAGVRIALWIMAASLVATGGFLVFSPYRHLRDLPTAVSPVSSVRVAPGAK